MIGLLCAGLVADRLAGLVKSQRARLCSGGIWGGLAQSGPLLLGVACGRVDRTACKEVRIVGFFKLLNILFFCSVKASYLILT